MMESTTHTARESYGGGGEGLRMERLHELVSRSLVLCVCECS